MSTDLDKTLLKIAKTRLIGEYIEATFGSTPEQAKIAATSAIADQFAFSGAVLTFKGTVAGTAEMAAKVREHFTENKLDFLIGNKTAEAGGDHNTDAALVALARSGNKTAQGKLFLQVGKDQAKLDAILSRKPFNAPDDDAPVDEVVKQNGGKNPWGAGPGEWNVTEQGRILRANPKLAASLAASAKSHIGATKPTRAA